MRTCVVRATVTLQYLGACSDAVDLKKTVQVFLEKNFMEFKNYVTAVQKFYLTSSLLVLL